MGLRAIVRGGRLVLDEETNLPEGTVLDLVVDDGGDDLTEEERAALNEAIEESLREAAQGLTSPASRILERIRAMRNEYSSMRS